MMPKPTRTAQEQVKTALSPHEGLGGELDLGEVGGEVGVEVGALGVEQHAVEQLADLRRGKKQSIRYDAQN